MCCEQMTLSKNGEIFFLAINAYLHNINVHTKLGENPFKFT